jgi:hypothetical protein
MSIAIGGKAKIPVESGGRLAEISSGAGEHFGKVSNMRYLIFQCIESL